MISQRLRIESVNGSPINDYRIESGHVEVRTLDPSGRYYPSPNSHWRPLDASDIQLHRALTSVIVLKPANDNHFETGRRTGTDLLLP